MFRLVVVLIALFSLSCNPPLNNNRQFDVPVFVYHRFGDQRYPTTNIATDVFEQQLAYLAENNFAVISFSEAMSRWQNGEPFAEKTVVLTIDDGYLSFYQNGFPLLKKYDMPATMFVQTATVGGQDFMNWEQLNEIHRNGIEVLNHSHSHDQFVNLPPDQISKVFRNDLLESTKLFERHMNFRPRYYSYPYGEFTPEMADVLKKNGYRASAAQKSGVLCETTNPYEVPRFPMGGVFATYDGFTSKANMRAIRVIQPEFGTSLLENNPPELSLEILPGFINTAQLQFFVDGSKSENYTIDLSGDNPVIILQHTSKLSGRHSLYTITAPSEGGGGWRWHTHLWIDQNAGN